MNGTVRADAAARGDLTYAPVRPCKRKHDAPRYTSSGGCTACAREREAEYYKQFSNIAIQRAKDRYAIIKADSKLNADYVARRRSNQRKYKKIPKPATPEPAVCECCGGPPNGKSKRLNVDHCHETGKFRGWLCWTCNVAIGNLGDNVAGVQRALDYLTLWQTTI